MHQLQTNLVDLYEDQMRSSAAQIFEYENNRNNYKLGWMDALYWHQSQPDYVEFLEWKITKKQGGQNGK